MKLMIDRLQKLNKVDIFGIRFIEKSYDEMLWNWSYVSLNGSVFKIVNAQINNFCTVI